MNARTITQTLLSLALAFSCSLAVADPVTCDPAMVTPTNEETRNSGWFQQMFAPPGKPQPFQGVITEGPDDGCSLSSDSRPVVSEFRLRDRNRAVD